MLFKVLEKYGKLKGDLELKQNMQKEIIESTGELMMQKNG